MQSTGNGRISNCGEVQTHGNLKNIVKYPTKVEYVTNAHSIFGPDLAGVKGKTVRHKSDRVEKYLTQIPRDLYEIHKFVTLATDLMFVNGIAFLTNLSRRTKSLTVERIPYRTTAHISSSLTKIVNIYTRRVFTVKGFLWVWSLKRCQMIWNFFK